MSDWYELYDFCSSGGQVEVPNAAANRTAIENNEETAAATVSTGFLKLVRLRKWCLKLRPSNKGRLFPNFTLHVKGFRMESDNDEVYWESSEIVKVRTQRVVLTKNTGYHLYTNMDMKQSRAEGFSSSFNEHFKEGFVKGWEEIIEVFGDYIATKDASVMKINKLLTGRSIVRHLPKQRFVRKNMTNLDKEQKLHEWIERNHAKEEARLKRKVDSSKNDEFTPRRKPLGITATKIKPINGKWTQEKVDKLLIVVKEINPCNDNDWNRVMQLFGGEYPLEEVKQQAEPMLFGFSAKDSPRTNLVETFKKLTPNGRIPKKGTVRRQIFEDAVFDVVLCKSRVDETPLQIHFDSDDEFIHSVMSDDTINVTRTYGELDESMKLRPVQHFLVDLNSNYKDINDVGDDFSIEYRDPQYKYAVQYKTKQANPRFRRTSDESDEDFECFVEKDDEESEPE